MKREVSLTALPAFCAELVKTFAPQQLVLLSGPLGAGKTQFVKYCVESLARDVQVDSPTFSVVNEYKTNPPVFHVDLYRLTTSADVESTGFWDLFLNKAGIIFLEWPERVDEKDFPLYWKVRKIKIDFTPDEQTRSFDY